MIRFMLLLSLGCLMDLADLGEGRLSVWQVPQEITAKRGNSVNMDCYFLVNDTGQVQVRVEWYLNNKNVSLGKTQNSRGLQNLSDSMSLQSVKRNDSGRYFCKVILEIPNYISMNGSGTILIIQDVSESAYIIYCWTALPSAAVLAGVGFLLYWKYKGNTSASRRRETDEQGSGTDAEHEPQYVTLAACTPDRARGNAEDEANGNDDLRKERKNVSRAESNAKTCDVVYSVVRYSNNTAQHNSQPNS